MIGTEPSIDPIGYLEERVGRLERLVALLLQKLEGEGVIKGPSLPPDEVIKDRE